MAIPVILLWGQKHNTNQKLKSLLLQNDLKSQPPGHREGRVPLSQGGVAWSVTTERTGETDLPERQACCQIWFPVPPQFSHL